MPTIRIIAGIDEAGRGPLAGPVVAAACVLPHPLYRRGRVHPRWSPFEQEPEKDILIADSKQLTPEERTTAFNWIISHCAFGIGISAHSVIDQKGILAATELAMQKAVHQLQACTNPTYLLVDGRDHFWFDLPHSSIIRGDEHEACIAAASIIAKVTRDRIMVRSDRVFPGYGFSSHKGYGSVEHIGCIRTLGPCPIHRRTFCRRIHYAEASLSPA